jgi:methylmalonyl-CoA/ethylmalonyl-CoA epimerase
MRTKGLYHVGVAVRSLAEGLALYRDTLGMSLIAQEDLPERGLKVAILAAGGSEVELLESTRPDSVIARFIERRGPGIHHLALEVDDIDTCLAELAAAGVRLVDAVARAGAGGTRVAFVHPAAAGGVLLELVEQARPKGAPGAGVEGASGSGTRPG